MAMSANGPITFSQKETDYPKYSDSSDNAFDFDHKV